MADRKLSETIRSATSVNLKYSADLLNLGREYVRAFTSALTEGASQDAATQDTARPPLLLAGKSGEIVNAAFAINNPGTMKGTVTLAVTGDFGDTKLGVDPERLSFDDGTDEVVVRILGTVGKKTPEGKDHPGSVIFPELDYRVMDFVLRKLPS